VKLGAAALREEATNTDVVAAAAVRLGM
jgi:hypothetical protein